VTENNLNVGEPAERYLAMRRAREVNPGPVAIPHDHVSLSQLIDIGTTEASETNDTDVGNCLLKSIELGLM
jgi:hypothetical protein